MRVHDIPTPALLIEAGALQHNLDEMAAARPGAALRPHVKAHKCTALAARQAAAGHAAFTCATPREMVGMAAAGLGDDLLLANEVLDPTRLAAMAAVQDTARVTVAVDSDATVEAAAAAASAGGADRRERRPAPLRLRARRRRPARRPGPGQGLDGARGHGLRGPPHGRRGPAPAQAQLEACVDDLLPGPRRSSAATWCRAGAPAPTTSTPG